MTQLAIRTLGREKLPFCMLLLFLYCTLLLFLDSLVVLVDDFLLLDTMRECLQSSCCFLGDVKLVQADALLLRAVETHRLVLVIRSAILHLVLGRVDSDAELSHLLLTLLFGLFDAFLSSVERGIDDS